MLNRASGLPIAFEGVSFASGRTEILREISLEFFPGRPTVVMGPNGSGKTTLLKLAMGLLQPTAGRIVLAGRPSQSSRPARAAIVFQRPVMLRRSAAANIAFALETTGRGAERTTIGRLLSLVGLDELAKRPARRLSGGEQQRLALARALAREPEILFLDEPTANLDPAAAKGVENIVERIADAGVKVVMATHDVGQARRLAGDILFLARGRLVERAAAPIFFDNPASREAQCFLAGDLVI